MQKIILFTFLLALMATLSYAKFGGESFDLNKFGSEEFGVGAYGESATEESPSGLIYLTDQDGTTLTDQDGTQLLAGDGTL